MKTLQISIVLLISILVSNCSSAGTYNNSDDKKNEKIIIINRTEDGKDVSYRAEYNDDKLVSIERNGEKVSEADMDKYSEIVQDELGDIRDDRIFEFKPNKHKVFKFKHFPDSSFTASMEKMHDKLSKIKRIEIKMDGLDDLKELDSLDIPEFDIKVDVDFDKLRADLDKVKAELQMLKEEFRSEKKKSK